MRHTARETWLQAAAETMALWIPQAGGNEIPPLRLSCGWAKRASKKSIGWCWQREVSADGVNEIQVSPEIAEPVQVLGTLLHEMIHASDDGESKHSGYFGVVARAVGLDGKLTATYPGDELHARLELVAAELGPYPHAALSPKAVVGKQGTRMLKLVCPDDGYTARTTQKWIDIGLPTCPCGAGMELEQSREATPNPT